MNKICLCYLTYLDFSILDGAATHATGFLENITKFQEIDVVYLFGFNSKSLRVSNHKIHPIDLVNIIPFLPFKVLGSIPHVVLELIRIKKKKGTMVIYERHSLSSPGVLFGNLLGIPTILEVNCIVSEEERASGQIRSRRLLDLMWKFECEIFKEATSIVVVTNYFKERLVRAGIPSDKIYVIPNGVDADVFCPMDRDYCRRKLNLPRGVPIACFVGSLGPWQGLDHLILAMTKIIKRMQHATLLVVGNGSLKEELKRLSARLGVENNIHFLSQRPHETIPLYINAADVCVLFKTKFEEKYEFSPLKLFEYMACDRPIVASKTPGLEVVQRIGCGVLVTPENHEEVAKAIMSIWKDPSKLAKRGRQYIMKHHLWKGIAHRIITIIQNSLLG